MAPRSRIAFPTNHFFAVKRAEAALSLSAYQRQLTACAQEVKLKWAQWRVGKHPFVSRSLRWQFCGGARCRRCGWRRASSSSIPPCDFRSVCSAGAADRACRHSGFPLSPDARVGALAYAVRGSTHASNLSADRPLGEQSSRSGEKKGRDGRSGIAVGAPVSAYCVPSPPPSCIPTGCALYVSGWGIRHVWSR